MRCRTRNSRQCEAIFLAVMAAGGIVVGNSASAQIFPIEPNAAPAEPVAPAGPVGGIPNPELEGSRKRAVEPGEAPLGRVNSRIENRLETRLRNRVDAAAADENAAPFERVEARGKTVEQRSRPR